MVRGVDRAGAFFVGLRDSLVFVDDKLGLLDAFCRLGGSCESEARIPPSLPSCVRRLALALLMVVCCRSVISSIINLGREARLAKS